MADDENLRELPPKEILSDESSVAYITAEPALLGNERLLVLGRSILTDVRDIVDLLAIDVSGAVHVIFLPHREADGETLAQLIPQGAWVNELSVTGLRDGFAGYRVDTTLDEAFADSSRASCLASWLVTGVLHLGETLANPAAVAILLWAECELAFED